MVGSKRFRTIAQGFTTLNANPPRDFVDRPDIANYAAVTAIEYITVRYTDREWLVDLPEVRAWRESQKGRASVETTMPYV